MPFFFLYLYGNNNIMAKINKDLEEGNKLLKEQAENVEFIKDAYRSMVEVLKDAIEDSIDSMQGLDDISARIAKSSERELVSSFKKLGNQLEKNVTIQAKILKGQNVSKDIENARININARLAQQIAKIELNTALSAEHQAHLVNDTMKQAKFGMDALDSLEGQNKATQKSVSIYGILGNSLGKYADKLDETGTLSGILKGNWSEVVTIQRIGQLAAISLITGLVKGIIQLDKLQTQYNKSFGMTDHQAASVHKRMSQIADASGRTSITFIDMHKAMEGIAKATGVLGTGLRDDVLEEAAEMQKLLGLSDKGMAMLAFNAQVTGQHMEAQSKSMVTGLQLAEADLGVTIDKRKVLQEVGETSGLIRANFGRNVQLMTEVIGKAKAFGITLQDLESISSNLLNFQSSIEAELTAELFIGKQLNLEKARLYALTGDYGKLQDEIVNNIGTEYDFLSMNVLAKQKYAAALGMSVDQMSNLVMKNADLAAIREQATAVNDQDTLNMLKQRELSERMADIMTKVQTTFVAIAEGPLGTFAEGLGNVLANATSLFFVLSAVGLLKFGGLVSGIYSMVTGLGMAGTAAAWTTGLLTAGIGLAVAIPVILGVISAMNKSKKEAQTASFQDLPAGKMVTVQQGEARIHQGEFVGHMSDFSKGFDKVVNAILQQKLQVQVESHHGTRYV